MSPFHFLQGVLHISSTMSWGIIHMEMESVPLPPSAMTSPEVDKLPHFPEDRFKCALVHILVLKILHIQKATPVKKWDHHHLLAAPFGLGYLRPVVLCTHPFLVLCLGPRLVDIKPRLICGNHPILEVVQAAVAEEILAEQDSLSLLMVSQDVRYQLGTDL